MPARPLSWPDMPYSLVARANVLVIGVVIAVVVIVSGVTWERIGAAREARESSQHSLRVLEVIKDLSLALRAAESGQRGFLLTGQEDYLAPYQAAIAQAPGLQDELRRLTADDAAEQRRMADLGLLVERKFTELGKTIGLRRDGKPDDALAEVRTDAGRALMRQIEDVMTAMQAEEQARLAEWQQTVDRRAGRVRTLIAVGTAIAILGLLLAAYLLNVALTRSGRLEADQRQAAERLQASFDSLSQGLAVFDAGRHLINWNRCFEELLHLPKTRLRPGASYAEVNALTVAEGKPLLESADQLRHGRQRGGQPIAYERPWKGSTLEFRRTTMPDGGFVLTVTDLTTRVQAETILRESQKMQAIGHLTGGIAHDFNNLLTVVLGNLEILRNRLGGDHPLQTRIGRALWATERGATLTRQLLAFARKQPLAPVTVDLTTVVADIVPILRRTLGERIDIRYVETARAWPALADPAQLESALLNLALNARDAMPDGGRLTIELANKVLDDAYARAHVEVSPGDYAMLAVTDTGHGMAPDVVARVFEPFFTTKADGKGTGLGLAMVFGFVKQSGGHIKIYSEPGEGTTVRLYLPRAIAPVDARRPRPPIDLPRGTATVLVVEDEAAVREIACAILSDLGHSVLEAADGTEGLALFTAHADRIDLLLTDVVLPGPLRGRDLAERATALRPGLKVLFMSGYTENSIVHGGRLDDGVSLIDKPFHREQLARKVAEVLGLEAPGRLP